MFTKVFASAFVLALAGCAVETAGSAGDEAARGPRGSGKADGTGTCEDRCGGAGSNGSCYCDSSCASYGDCCDDYATVCGGGSEPPSGGVPEFGESPSFQILASAADGLSVPRDLEFNPERPDELWTVNQAIDGTVIVLDPGTSSQRIEVRVDSHANHFMEEVSSIAFGANETFGTCQESRNTYDHHAPANDFMGPALWPSDLSIYAAANQDPSSELLGSHLDMLHQSPYCMGMAHDRANVYWVFDGLHGDIVRYDFQRDHGPGYDDHSDGIVRRYDTSVRRTRGIPSHLELDSATGWLYVADTGNHRVIRLDTRSGSEAYALEPYAEPLAEYTMWTGATVDVVTTSGLTSPSGIALHDGRLFVSDAWNGDIVALDPESGAELGRIHTGNAGVYGLTFGPDDKLYFVNGVEQILVRVDP